MKLPVRLHRGRFGQRRQGGFFRPQPWLRGARELPHPAANTLTGVTVAVVGLLTAIGLFSANGEPSLPSSHAVLVSVRPTSGSQVHGGGHLIWYRSGGLLVLNLGVRGLPARARVAAYLAPGGSCSGQRPGNARLVARSRSDGQGYAHVNGELLRVSSLNFSAWSIWVRGPGQRSNSAACGVISLAGSALARP